MIVDPKDGTKKIKNPKYVALGDHVDAHDVEARKVAKPWRWFKEN